MIIAFHDALFFFTLYAILGWIFESALVSVFRRRFVNRGFLVGPYCPIYGFGAVLILIATDAALDHPLLVFL
ncbi:putative ABC transporter permease, partial [Oscillospiraceae bacterium OttesenSCG-928-F05]|nr:putative ABC transporter permease [Oscillospiraceae bacterium OttesenSCG-928-F05]